MSTLTFAQGPGFTMANAFFGGFTYAAIVWFTSRSAGHFEAVAEKTGQTLPYFGAPGSMRSYRIATWFLNVTLALAMLFWWILPEQEVVAYWFTFGFFILGLLLNALGLHAYYEALAKRFGVMLGTLGTLALIGALGALLSQLISSRRGVTPDAVDPSITAEGVCKFFPLEPFVCFPYGLLIAANILLFLFIIGNLFYLFMARNKAAKDQENLGTKTN